ncbi:MAG: penicillin-binding protein activator LpoB, partial [Treponema sp.]|nr:penicillin-binding protein activator LpoB [Treponema sp.]
MNFVRQARMLSRALLAGLLFLAFTAGAYAQNGERLGKIAILPFSGGSVDEQEGIAELLSYTQEIMDNFNVIPRTGITRAAKQEQAFQALSGMTDADTIVKLGKQFGADYVMAGSITSLGNRHLLIVSVIKIDEIRQVAGDYLVYDSLDALNNDEKLRND